MKRNDKQLRYQKLKQSLNESLETKNDFSIGGTSSEILFITEDGVKVYKDTTVLGVNRNTFHVKELCWKNCMNMGLKPNYQHDNVLYFYYRDALNNYLKQLLHMKHIY